MRSAAVAERPSVALCAGKDCRKRCEFAKIRDALDEHCDVVELKCVGICAGPVVVARPESKRPVVLSKLRTKRQRNQLVEVVVGGADLPPALRDRIVKKSKRASVVRQVRRTVAAR